MLMEAAEMIPASRNLQNKPLAEAIFELRWELQPQAAPGGVSQSRSVTSVARPALVDPGFKILVGVFYSKISNQFPFAKDLPAAQIPEVLAPYAVRHQFRVSAEEWPVIQLGPGVLTLNETTNYTWSDFKRRLLDAVTALLSGYPRTIAAWKPTMFLLRYINTIAFDYRRENIAAFLRDSLHTTVQIDPQLFEHTSRIYDPNSMILRVTLPTAKPNGVGTISFASGMQEDKPVIVWELAMQSEGIDAPQEPDSFENWVDEAHDVIERWFFTLCRGKLLDKFEGK